MEKYIDAGGVRLFCRVYGQGEPVLMIHGACIDSDFFEETARLLSSRYKVFTYDRRGHGRSDGSPENTSDANMHYKDALYLLEWITGTFGGPCRIIANSSGGNIALAVASKHPKLVKSILVHEPAIVNCLPEGDPFFGEFSQAKSLIAEGLYTQPLFILLGQENFEDERRPEKPFPKYKDRDAMQFIRADFPEILFPDIDFETLKKIPVYVGLGEQDSHTYHKRLTPILCDRCDASTVYFPGSHNCAEDLPLEFAAIAMGLFQLECD